MKHVKGFLSLRLLVNGLGVKMIKANNINRGKKAQAGIIVAVLLILIVLVAIVIIWNLVSVVVSGGESGSNTDVLSVKLDIEKVILFVGGASHVNVERGVGGKMDGMRFAFYGGEGKVELVDEIGIIEELGIGSYSFEPLGIGNIEKVSVFPILEGQMGNEFEFKENSDLGIPSGLISWWEFENTEDSVRRNSGFLVGGFLNNGVLSSGYFLVSDDDSLDFSEEMSLGVWINVDEGVVSNGVVIDKGGNYKLSIVDGKVVFEFVDEEEVKIVESIDRIGEVRGDESGWHYLIVSLSKGGVSNMYVDGDLVRGFDVVDFLEVNDIDLRIGDGFNGEIDEVMIFNKALSNVEVKGLFGVGRGGLVGEV